MSTGPSASQRAIGRTAFPQTTMMVSGSMRMLRAPASRSMGAVRGLHMTKVARGVQQPMSEAQTAEYPREGM